MVYGLWPGPGPSRRRLPAARPPCRAPSFPRPLLSAHAEHIPPPKLALDFSILYYIVLLFILYVLYYINIRYQVCLISYLILSLVSLNFAMVLPAGPAPPMLYCIILY